MLLIALYFLCNDGEALIVSTPENFGPLAIPQTKEDFNFKGEHQAT